MVGRRWLGLVLSILTVPILVLGLIDPLEGGIAMLIGGALTVVTWLVSRVPVPRLEWIAWLTAFISGGLALLGAVLLWQQSPGGPEGMPWWVLVPLVVYEIAVAATIAGGVWFVARHVRALRHHQEPVAGILAR